MKTHVLKYVLLLSLLLNLSCLGAAGFTHYRKTRHPSAAIDHGPRGQAQSGSSTQAHIFEALSLKSDQQELLQKEAAAFHEALDKKNARVAELRSALLDLMRADIPDRRAIESAITEISEGQREMQELVIAHMLEFKSMLDKDQQRKFLDLIQGAMMEKGAVQCP